MFYMFLKAAISGVIVALVSEIAKRYPGLGAIVASLPLISILGMLWLWRDKVNTETLARHAEGTFWYVLPSLPMFLMIPLLLRRGIAFPVALLCGCGLTIGLYLTMVFLMSRIGVKL